MWKFLVEKYMVIILENIKDERFLEWIKKEKKKIDSLN